MLPAMELSGTTAIISGGASGLGEATARMLAAAGSTVVIADLNEERGKAVAAETGGEFVKTDVSDEASVTAAVEAAVSKGAPLRTVVNCAGIGWADRPVNRAGAPPALATYRKVVDTTLTAPFTLMPIGAPATPRAAPSAAHAGTGSARATSRSGRRNGTPWISRRDGMPAKPRTPAPRASASRTVSA